MDQKFFPYSDFGILKGYFPALPQPANDAHCRLNMAACVSQLIVCIFQTLQRKVDVAVLQLFYHPEANRQTPAIICPICCDFTVKT